MIVIDAIKESPKAMDIYRLLLSIRVPIKVHGYRYIRKALDILLNDEGAAFAITKLVYMKIADEYGLECKQVESAMRIAIDQAWERGGCDEQEMIFGYSKMDGKKPCISEFLFRIAEYLKVSVS